ncbi:MAG: dipicolinate synthase subunit B [Acutalibacteraceae bacterium]
MLTVGFALCGSYCTFKKVIAQLEILAQDKDLIIVPIMSENAYSLDTRFGTAKDFVKEVEELTKNKVLHSLNEVEPIGPKNLLDALIIAPCTGNTLAKLAAGVADTSVTFAAKAHLRNEKPIIIGISTNDALAAAAKNIGALHNAKNFYFIPYRQDDCKKKPNSIVADFTKTRVALDCALRHEQTQPVIIS